MQGQPTWQNLVVALQVHRVDRDTEICRIWLATHCTAYSASPSPRQASSRNCPQKHKLIASKKFYWLVSKISQTVE